MNVRRQLGAACAIALMAAATVAATQAAGAADIVDQEQSGSTFTNTVNVALERAQTFTAGRTGLLTRVELTLNRVEDPAPLIVEVRDVVSDAPGTTVLASAQVEPAAIPVAGDENPKAFVQVPFGSPAEVQSGTQYALVLSTGETTAGLYGAGGVSEGDPYLVGAQFRSESGGPWTAEPGYDLAFRTVVTTPDPTPAPTPTPKPTPTPTPTLEAKCDFSGSTRGFTVIKGTNADDVLRGTTGRDLIFGYGGDDEIRGRGGKDVLCGGGGKDELYGGHSADRLLGGPGNDRLFGNRGDDVLKGNSGGDVLRGGFGDDRVSGGTGPDDVRS